MDGDELIKVMKYFLCLKGVRLGRLCKLFMGRLISNVSCFSFSFILSVAAGRQSGDAGE